MKDGIKQLLAELSPEKRSMLVARLGIGVENDHRIEAIAHSREGNAIALSFSQERIWLHQQLQPGSVAYNRPTNLRIQGLLDVESLRRALAYVLSRHESMRTTVNRVDGIPFLRIHRPLVPDIPLVDLSGEAEPEARTLELAAKEAAKPFDLEKGPLLRASLLRLHQQDHLLLLTIHHFTFDAWSQRILIEELGKAYPVIRRGKIPSAEDLPIQYRDFAAWDRSAQRLKKLEAGRTYWRKQLADPPLLQMSTDFPRSAVPTERAGYVEINIPVALVAGLRKLASVEQSTLFAVLLSAFATLLYRYSGDEDIVVGCPYAGRTRSETKSLIGVFINTLPLRLQFIGGKTSRDLLGAAKECLARGLEFSEVPFQWMVQDVLNNRDGSGSPLFQAMFIHERLPQTPVSSESLVIESQDQPVPAIPSELALELFEDDEHVSGRFIYRLELWERVTIERMVGHYVNLMEAMLANPDQRVDKLPLLTHRERRKLLLEWNDTAIEYPSKCVHQLFEEQAECTPLAMAVIFEGLELSYRELNERANQLAHYLLEIGAGSGTLVGLCFERSPELIIGMLAILKTGAAYLPLDPDLPGQRLEFMLCDAEVSHLVTSNACLEKLPAVACHVVSVDRESDHLNTFNCLNPAVDSNLEDLVYVLFTSGSTGRPKGVAMQQAALVNLLEWHRRHPRLSQTARTLQFASITFDVSFQEILTTLSCGGTLVMVSERIRYDTEALWNQIIEKRVERLFMPYVAVQQLAIVANGNGHLSSLRDIISAGETLQLTPEIRRLFEDLNDCRLHNHYGPTESHVVTTLELRQDPSTWPTEAPIGIPIANTQVFVLDKRRELTPVGVPGELYIGGVCLARGYVNRDELTREKFVLNPFSANAGSRLYWTGDLCRWRTDGSLEFIGRIDNQVKIRGYRIELGEIEAVLCRHSQVDQCVVVVNQQREKKLLAAYLICKVDQLSVQEIRLYLEEYLPEYMIPTAFVFLDAFPLTSSGKVDRAALPLPNPLVGFVTPVTSLETDIAEIWQSVLGTERVGLDDNFFELGGNSFTLVQVHDRLNRNLNLDLSVVDLFQHSTIRSLAHYLSHEDNDPAVDAAAERALRQRLAFRQHHRRRK